MRLALAALAGAIALGIGGILIPTSPTPEGGHTLEGWWLLQAGVALALASAAASPAWRRAAWLAALFALATAAQLALTHPHWLQYLELNPERIGNGTGPVAAVILLLQTLVVLGLLRQRGMTVRSAGRALLSMRSLIVAGGLFVFAAAHVSPYVGGHPGTPDVGPLLLRIAAVGGLICLNLAHLACLADALPASRLATIQRRLAARLTLPGAERPQPTRLDRAVPWLLALFVFLVAGGVACFVFDRVPHIPDSIGYVFHSHGLGEGMLSAPAPPVHEAFDIYLVEADGSQWYTTMNPGWPMVLALGSKLGLPWIVNPLLAALCIPLLHVLVRRLLGTGWAHVAAGLAATSPWFLFLAASHMTHTLTLLLMLGAWVLAQRAASSERALPALIGGLLLGYMVSVRSLDGLVIGVATGVWLLFVNRSRLRVVGAYAVGCVAGASGWLAYNYHFTGSALRDPLNAYFDKIWYPGANRLGFGADVGNPPGGWDVLDPLPGHGFADVLLNANQNLYNLNFELHGFAIGSLFLTAVHLAFGRFTREDRWFLCFLVLIPAAYSLYWFSGGPDFGARYWFPVFAPCIWFSVRGLATLAEWATTRMGAGAAGARVGALLVLLGFLSLATFDSWRVTARYVDYRGFHADYLHMVESGELGNALVLVKTSTPGDWGSAFLLNRPLLDADRPVFARDLDPDTTRRVIAAFPERPVIRVVGRSITGTVSRITSSSMPRR